MLTLIPLSSYLFKDVILSYLPPNLGGKTQSQIIVKPGSCLILEEEYCPKVKVIDWTNPSGQESHIISLPPNVPLLMPVDGQVAKAKLPDDGRVFPGFKVQVFDPNKPVNSNTLWYVFAGDLQLPNMLSLNMKQGESFGRSGKKIVFYILRGIGRETTNDADEMRKMFPAIKL